MGVLFSTEELRTFLRCGERQFSDASFRWRHV